MNKIVWVRPSGTECTTNDLPHNIEAAKALGWKRKDSVKVAEQVKPATQQQPK